MSIDARDIRYYKPVIYTETHPRRRTLPILTRSSRPLAPRTQKYPSCTELPDTYSELKMLMSNLYKTPIQTHTSELHSKLFLELTSLNDPNYITSRNKT